MAVMMVDGEYADGDLGLLTAYLRLLDQELGKITSAIGRVGDPESEGLLEAGEYLVGNGYVAIQRYLTSTRSSLGVERRKAFAAGPTVNGGLTLATALNAGANYWKHMEEWLETLNYEGAEALRRDAIRTIEQIETVTPWADYTCANLLATITNSGELRLSPLIPFIAQWRNSLLEA